MVVQAGNFVLRRHYGFVEKTKKDSSNWSSKSINRTVVTQGGRHIQERKRPESLTACAGAAVLLEAGEPDLYPSFTCLPPVYRWMSASVGELLTFLKKTRCFDL